MARSQVGQIDDVQELKRTNPSHVPARFMREELSLDKAIPFSDTIPIIDISKLVNGSKDDFSREIANLKSACQEWGLFQAVNHGVDLEEMERVAMEFFMLPLEEKKKYPMPVNGKIQGYGQAFVFSEDQKLDWCNMFALGLQPHSLRMPHLWPTNPSDFSETLERYTVEVRELCKNVLRCIAITLDLKDEETFNDMFGIAVQAVRMNYYPACPRPELVYGLSPHSDGSAITVLHQNKGSPAGLQIRKNDDWFSILPIPNALIIHLGDTTEVLTNGIYKSVEHRAVTHKEMDRLSLVTFYAPSYDIEIGPIPELVNKENPCKFRTYPHIEYNKHYVTNKLQGKERLEFTKLEDN